MRNKLIVNLISLSIIFLISDYILISSSLNKNGWQIALAATGCIIFFSLLTLLILQLINRNDFENHPVK